MATTTQQDRVIGQGISNPPEFSDYKQNELLKLVAGENVINQSIYDILTTRIGERFNNVEYGSNLYDLVFEPNDQILKDLLYYNIITVLQRWERRITIMDVKMYTDDELMSGIDYHGGNAINVAISYVVNSTNQPGSFVFPFVRSGMPSESLTQGKESAVFSYPTKKG